MKILLDLRINGVVVVHSQAKSFGGLNQIELESKVLPWQHPHASRGRRPRSSKVPNETTLSPLCMEHSNGQDVSTNRPQD